jgi:N-acetylglucosamine-6-phosphate deacetylase
MLLIKNGKLIFHDGILETSILVDEKIIAIGKEADKQADCEVLDAKGCYVSPGFIDIHCHGGGNGDFLDCSADSIEKALKAHTAHGTTTMYPTTLAGDIDELREALALLDGFVGHENGYCKVRGIHLEGPFLNPVFKGAQDEKYLLDPDIKILDLSENIRRVTFAPELNGGTAFAKELHSRGIRGAIGHSDASDETINAVAEYGVDHVTHLYSGMNTVHRENGYRKVGLVERAYLDDRLSVELIADGKHLPRELLALAQMVKKGKTIVVTDAMRAAGYSSNDSTSIIGSKKHGQKVILRDDVAFMPDGQAFAGSTGTMDRLVRNMIGAGLSLTDAVNCASYNVAKVCGLNDVGEIAVSKCADLLLFDEDINIQKVIINGNIYK